MPAEPAPDTTLDELSRRPPIVLLVAFVAVSLEKGYDDMFFDDRRTTELFDTFVAEFTAP